MFLTKASLPKRMTAGCNEIALKAVVKDAKAVSENARGQWKKRKHPPINHLMGTRTPFRRYYVVGQLVAIKRGANPDVPGKSKRLRSTDLAKLTLEQDLQESMAGSDGYQSVR